jgi:hypothetical protein
MHERAGQEDARRVWWREAKSVVNSAVGRQPFL